MNNPVRDLIASLRGGAPKKCDWCDADTDPDELIPVSGGEWVCAVCCNYLDPKTK